MTYASGSEPLLTLDQGYLAAYHFIRQFYERDARKSESMFFLLTWMRLEAPRMSADPAQWDDWLGAVTKALAEGTDRPFADPLPDPLSK